MLKNTFSLNEKQFPKFKKQLEYIYTNSKTYHEKLKECGITPNDIQSIDDLDKLPLTTKKDFHESSIYDYYCVPENKIARFHASSGSTGKPTIVGLTKNDLKLRNQMIITQCQKTGITSDDVIQICYGYGMFTGGLGFHEALSEYGCTIVPTGSGNSEKQLYYMKKLRTTVLISGPYYALHLAEVAKQKGIDVKNFNLKIIKVGSELVTEKMRQKLKEAWGQQVIISQDYGMTELIGPCAASECPLQNGMHIYEDNFIIELVDPITKQTTDKNTGELIISTLNNECFPLIRYATNDIVTLETSPCKCGNHTIKIKKIIGRADDMLKIKGVKVFLSQIEDFILSYDFCTPNYEIVLTKKDFIDQVEINIEYNKPNYLKSFQTAEQKLANAFQNYFGIKASINLINPNTIKQTTGKAKKSKTCAQKKLCNKSFFYSTLINS